MNTDNRTADRQIDLAGSGGGVVEQPADISIIADDRAGTEPRPPTSAQTMEDAGRPSSWPRQWILPLAIWLGFVAVAAGTFVAWESQGLYRAVGDEPHYLVMADGIIRDRTFEQTATYQREFDQQIIYPGGLAPAGSEVSPLNTHALAGPNGLYNVHNIGLPILLAVPWVVGGIVGAKLVMVLLVSLVVPLAWRFSGRFSSDLRVRAVTTIVATYTLPFVLGGNQIFPDLPAGVFALLGIDRVFAVAAGVNGHRPGSTGSGAGRPVGLWRGAGDAAVLAVIAYLPWLQIKFVSAAVLITAALVAMWWRTGRRRSVLGASLLPLVGSLGLLAAYNRHAFGQASGPYDDGALEVSVTAMSVLAGLHLDRFQGILIQAPLYLVAVLFAVPFIRRAWLPGGLVLVTYASFVVPNALHPVWYGATSFAGRFVWSAAVVAIPAVVYGLIRVAGLSKLVFSALAGLALAGAAVTWAPLLVGPGDLYNRTAQLQYPDLFPVAESFLPAFRDPDLAFRLATNLAFFILVAGLVLVGGLVPNEAPGEAPNRVPDEVPNEVGGAGEADRRPEGSRRFGLVLGGFLGVWAAGVITIGVVAPYREEPLFWTATELSSDIGTVDGTSRSATEADGPGYLAYGPYNGLWLDEYRYRVVVEATAPVDDPTAGPIAIVDVFSPETFTVIQSHEVWPTTPGRSTEISGRFEVPEELENNLLEIRTFYNGRGSVTVRSVELDR